MYFSGDIKKPFTKLAVLIFILISFVHLLRIVQGWEVIINNLVIPMITSILGLIISAVMAIMLAIEMKR